MRLIKGTTITVLHPQQGAMDEFGEAAITYDPEQVSDVLVAPGSSIDDPGRTDIDRTRIVYRLHFPKTYKKRLDGCLIEIDGERFKIIGSPRQMMPENTPTRWGMVADCEAFYE